MYSAAATWRLEPPPCPRERPACGPDPLLGGDRAVALCGIDGEEQQGLSFLDSHLNRGPPLRDRLGDDGVGRSLDLVRKAAISLQAGGVGYYPASQFVHVDVGRVRTW